MMAYKRVGDLNRLVSYIFLFSANCALEFQDFITSAVKTFLAKVFKEFQKDADQKN